MRTQQHRSALGAQGRLIAALGLVSMVVVGAVVIASEDLPAFRQGMWKFTRTVGGKPVETTKCTNPTDDMKRQSAMVQKAGCTVSPIRKAGNTYTFESDCSLKGPRGGGITSHTTTVMTVESDSAYRLEVAGTQDGEPMKETLVARRVGDCAR
ncbi:MAG TPA: DUF3617 family protein [Vicinamibacterales bacterium]